MTKHVMKALWILKKENSDHIHRKNNIIDTIHMSHTKYNYISMIYEITDMKNITIVSMTLHTTLTIHKSTTNILNAGIINSTCPYGAGI